MSVLDADRCGQEPVYSEFAGDPEFAGLLRVFVRALPTVAAELHESISRRRIDEVRIHAHHLKGTGGGYGFPLLTEAATNLEGACDSDDLIRIASAVDELTRLFARIRI